MEPLCRRHRVWVQMAKFPFIDLPPTQSKRFEELVRPHVLALYRFRLSSAAQPADAEDLVQDVLAKLYPQTNEMTQVRELRPWLMRVVYHQFVDVTRRRNRTPSHCRMRSSGGRRSHSGTRPSGRCCGAIGSCPCRGRSLAARSTVAGGAASGRRLHAGGGGADARRTLGNVEVASAPDARRTEKAP